MLSCFSAKSVIFVLFCIQLLLKHNLTLSVVVVIIYQYFVDFMIGHINFQLTAVCFRSLLLVLLPTICKQLLAHNFFFRISK